MNVGCRALEVPDAVQGVRIPMLLLYPTRAPEAPARFGPYELAIAKDASPEGDGLPLVVVSHGRGSTPLASRGLGAHLARAGFVVAVPEHIGNSRSDNALDGTPANLANRPRHVRLCIDAALADETIGARIANDRGVGVVGHSMGGYTALAVAGGKPRALPHETAHGASEPVTVERDRRVRAIVLLAPATVWFAADDALAEVDLPILLRTAELDESTTAIHGAIVLDGVPDRARVDHRVVPGAGHFAFLTPFAPAMVSTSFPPSQDPPGFDRAAYQVVSYGEVEAFFRANL